MGSFGERVKELRGNRTMAEIAGKTSISVTFISQIESGVRNPSLSTLKKLAAALGIHQSELLR